MDYDTPISTLTRSLIESGHGSMEGLANELGVSSPTLLRWASGQAAPRADMEGRIRALANERLRRGIALQTALFDFPSRDAHGIREALQVVLQEMREILHRSGRLSSRHEAIDELGKLLFAHVMSIDGGGTGICDRIVGDGRPAAGLRNFIAETIRSHLPTSLSHELQPEDFQLRLKDSEDRFAQEVIDCFGQLSSPDLVGQIRGAKGVDVLNDTFGQFLADSFSDEKELGQYLTPPEVVSFMVRLALQSLDPSDLDALINPAACTSAGIVLDPSCGVGSFLSEMLRVLQPQVRDRHGEAALSSWIESMMATVLVGIDKSERMIRLALTNLALFGVPAANLHLANSLVRVGPDARLTNALAGTAKIILTNPPFGAEFGALDLDGYKLTREWAGRPVQSVDSELLFLERYIDWLAPNGILVAIVPDSVLTNRGLFADLRRGISSSIRLRSVVSLPSVTFGVAGTNTKTSVLHLQKTENKGTRRDTVYFGICGNVGFDVETRGSQRHKVSIGPGDLPVLLREIHGEAPLRIGRLFDLAPNESRWDATFHASLPIAIQRKLEMCGQACLRVRDVAILANDRVDPRQSGRPTFQYIEIGDVSPHDCMVRGKEMGTPDPPSRARKLVRAGDVLVSTVRPERKAVGIVPNQLDGAVCSTGFAVLRCTSIEPIILARLLQSDFVNAQVLRNNVGIAYPAVEESCLLDVVLPIEKCYLADMEECCKKMMQLREKAQQLDRELCERIDRLTSEWKA